MIILVAIAVFDVILLAATVLSTRRRPARVPVRIGGRRADGMPHAL
jgi:hypothetical protein